MSRESSKDMSGPLRRLIERAVYTVTTCAFIATIPLHNSRADAQAEPNKATPVPPEQPSETPGGSLLSRLSDELKQLKEDRESLKSAAADSAPEPDAADSLDRAASLRRQILDLVEKLNRRVSPEEQANNTAAPTLNTPVAKRRSGTSGRQRTGADAKPSNDQVAAGFQGAGQAADPLALARVLIHHGDYGAALAQLQAVTLAKLPIDERLMVQYLTATCLRKQGNTKDASLLYREVANSKGDELVADCAHWQLNSIRWSEELHAQLEQLRQRRQALENQR